MRGNATWLILIAVGAVVTAGVVDAVRGSASNPEAALAGESASEPSATMALPEQTATEPPASTESEATTEPVPEATAASVQKPSATEAPHVHAITPGPGDGAAAAGEAKTVPARPRGLTHA